MDGVAHLVVERLDLVPLQERRPTRRVCRAESAHEHDDRLLVLAWSTFPLDRLDDESLELIPLEPNTVDLGIAPSFKVALDVVVVHSSRAAHRVVRRARRLALPREEVAIDGSDPALVLVDDTQFPHSLCPHLAFPHVLNLEADAVQRGKEAREAGKDGADGEEGRHVGQGVCCAVRCGRQVGVKVAVPRLNHSRILLASPAACSRLREMRRLRTSQNLEVLLR